jgi:hypothetical protein
VTLRPSPASRGINCVDQAGKASLRAETPSPSASWKGAGGGSAPSLVERFKQFGQQTLSPLEPLLDEEHRLSSLVPRHADPGTAGPESRRRLFGCRVSWNHSRGLSPRLSGKKRLVRLVSGCCRVRSHRPSVTGGTEERLIDLKSAPLRPSLLIRDRSGIHTFRPQSTVWPSASLCGPPSK